MGDTRHQGNVDRIFSSGTEGCTTPADQQVLDGNTREQGTWQGKHTFDSKKVSITLLSSAACY